MRLSDRFRAVLRPMSSCTSRHNGSGGKTAFTEPGPKLERVLPQVLHGFPYRTASTLDIGGVRGLGVIFPETGAENISAPRSRAG